MKKTQTTSGKAKREPTPPAEFPVEGLTRENLAAAFGVSVRCISKWLLKGLPRKESGYSLPECIAWFGGQQTGRVEAKVQKKEGAEDSPWMEMYRKERARTARLDRLARQGSLLPREKMEEAFTERAYEIARGVLQMSRRIGHKIAEKSGVPLKEVVRIVDQEGMRMCEEYSRPIEIVEGKVA